MKNNALLALIASFLVSVLSLGLLAGDAVAQSKTTTYMYDALGRVTYVIDPVNGNRDYDYDAAGNRRVVATGTANDGAVEPGAGGPFAPPAKPGVSSQYQYDCAWSANWGQPATTTHFIFKSTQNQSQQFPSSTLSTTVFCDSGMPSSNKPNWIQACNSLGCSDKAYFP